MFQCGQKNCNSVARLHWVSLLAVVVFGTTVIACDRTRSITASGDPPNIQSVKATPRVIAVGESSLLTVIADDPNGGTLTYEWDVGLGEIFGQGAEVYYSAQWCCLGTNEISVRVINDGGGAAVATVLVTTTAP